MAIKYIHRALEERIRKLAASNKAILITGARQVGKSTLLRHCFDNYRYVTLDDRNQTEQQCVCA